MEKKNMLKEYKVYILLLAILVAGVILAGVKSAQKASAVLYNEGTYVGEGQGFGGKITVTLTVDANSILEVVVEHENETQGIGGKEAVEDGTFAQQILDAQGGEIEGVSSASFTTAGVRAAYEAALAQAKVAE